jgi:hypothetical protein
MPPLLLPEFVTEALPPPVVNDSKPAADPELLVVALWFVPAALFVKGAGAVPELVQLISPAVVVQTKSAAAGELADRASSESAAAEPSVEVETKKVDLSIARRRARRFAANAFADLFERDMRLRTVLAPNHPMN